MTTYLTRDLNLQSQRFTVHLMVFGWFRRRLEQHRQRKLEKCEIEHLRRLEPYLLADAGVDAAGLHSFFARIMDSHPNFIVASHANRHSGK